MIAFYKIFFYIINFLEYKKVYLKNYPINLIDNLCFTHSFIIHIMTESDRKLIIKY